MICPSDHCYWFIEPSAIGASDHWSHCTICTSTPCGAIICFNVSHSFVARFSRIQRFSPVMHQGIRPAYHESMSKADDLQARTDAFCDLSIKFVEGLPNTNLVRRMADQFQDASTSVGANYRAARRAKSRADFVSEIGTVSEEADESVFWLTRMRNANIRSEHVQLEPLLAEAEELARIFGASHRTAKRKQRKRSDDPMDR